MNNRILVIDDDSQVIETYREIFDPAEDELSLLADAVGLLDEPDKGYLSFPFQMMSATQGEDGVALATMAYEMGQPFAVALIDMRMPPGWDGLRTATALRELDSQIYIVIVTAYTDRSIEEIHSILQHDAVLVYKPFTGDEIFQLARTLCISWNDRKEKEAAFEEVEKLASYPDENPAPVLRFSETGELLYFNSYSDPVLSMMGLSALGDGLVGAWLKRIQAVYQDGRMLDIQAASGSQFFLLTLVPIHDKGYINCYARDETRRYLLTRQLTYQARHDSLTGLINRREFIRKLNLVLRRIHDQGGEHALLYLDMEHFKEVNDAVGHLAGDQVLQEFSNMLLNEVKDGDVLSRIGGDEYAMLVYNVTPEQARSVGKRLSRAVAKKAFRWHGNEYSLGVTVGIAMLQHDKLGDAEELLMRADSACYAAKELGEGEVYIHSLDRPVSEKQVERVELANEVQEALNSGGFVLYRQRIESTQRSGEGELRYEVLLRMEGDDGVISPAEFIPNSERFNLMVVLDRWVIEHTLHTISAESESDLPATYIINISGTTLAGEGIEIYIRDQIQEYGVKPSRLIFEVTEQVAYSQVTELQQFIEEIHQLGARISIAEYGGLGASFTTLQKLPVDILKIDGKLIQGVIHNPVEKTIVESIQRLAEVLGMESTALSVENQETVRVLRRLGIDYLQGFHIGKPEPWDA